MAVWGCEGVEDFFSHTPIHPYTHTTYQARARKKRTLMSDNWQKIKTLFAEACQRAPEERAAFLEEACAGDPALRQEVTALLEADARPGPLDVLSANVITPLLSRIHQGSADLAGERVGPYTLIGKIGHGGMGIVFKARDTRLDRFVALKFLPWHLQTNAQAELRFFDEARAASALDHPNICTVYDIGQTADGQHYIAMAYYEGQTLTQHIARHPLPLDTCLDVALQMTAGLGCAHDAGIIHRDVKPSNILMTESGTVKILDFGVAKLEDGVPLTEPGMQLGTAAYMSPEQMRGEGVDHRTDLWSLGVVLYEMLAGQRPFEGPYRDALQYAIAHEEPSTLSRWRNGLPPALESIVYKCLEKDPTHRYQRADDLRAALQTLHTSETGHRTTAAATAPAAFSNLPAPMTNFVGREHEIARVKEILKTVRLLTLTGPAGTGKTRMGVQVASEMTESFEDGVFFVPLATITNPDLIVSAMAHALSMVESSTRSTLESLKVILKSRHVLLVLDNFEQVAAGAYVVAELLEACPMLKMLITSRVALRLSGEHEFPVPPLSVPDAFHGGGADALHQYSAIALFEARAQAVRPGFILTDENARAVAELCVRLDGLPLAIELAAARIKLFSPQAMLARLGNRLDLLKGGPRDRPARHQTLRQAIAWSYDLLDPTTQRLFQRLAVFVDGCTLEAAESVCRTGGDLSVEVIDGIAILVDQNLLQQHEIQEGEPRFSMLETIRDYALERLRQTDDWEAVHQAHATYFLAFAEQAEPELTGANQGLWLDRLEAEHDNLRAALTWNEMQGDAEQGLRMGAALWRFWAVRGYLVEGRRTLERLLGLPGAEAHTRARAKALNGAGTLLHEVGDYPQARSLLEESLTLWREIGDKKGIATGLNNLGWVAMLLGDHASGRALSEEALALCRTLGDQRGMALSLNNLGWVAMLLGDLAPGRTLQQESLHLRRALGDKRGVAFALTNLAVIEQYAGAYEQATAHLEKAQATLETLNDRQLLTWVNDVRSLMARRQGQPARAASLAAENVQAWRDMESREGISYTLNCLAEAKCDLGHYEEAAQLLEESLSISRAAGLRWHLTWALWCRGRLAQAQQDDARAEALLAESLAIRRDLGDKRGIAECLEALATSALRRNDPDHAVRLLGAAAALRTTIQIPIPPCDLPAYEHLLTQLRTALGDAAFARVWSDGAALSLDEAVTSALA